MENNKNQDLTSEQSSNNQQDIKESILSHSQPKKTNKRIIISAVFFVVIIAIVIFVLAINKSNNNTPVQNDTVELYESLDPENSTQDSDNSIEVPKRGTYYLRESSEKLRVYDLNLRESSASDDEELDYNQYVEIELNPDWKIYEKPLDSQALELGGYFIETDTGKYIHINRVSGVGGDCYANNDTYTLTKKLPTQIPNHSFVAYDVEGDERSNYLMLEDFGRQESFTGNKDSTWTKHLNLKEGESNTDTCNKAGYSFVNINSSLYITLSNTNVSQLSSSLTWDDIKDDADFLRSISSLSFHSD